MRWLSLLLVLLVGCSSPSILPTKIAYLVPIESSTAQATVSLLPIIDCYNKSLEPYKYGCYMEAKKRFSNPVVVVCHGRTQLNNWVAVTDNDGIIVVNDLAWKYSLKYKDCDIVLFICNFDAHTLNVPRVWYFKQSVWMMPDSEVRSLRENVRGVGNAGSIWEAVTQNGSWR